MKQSHIFGIVIIAIAVGIIMSTAGDASQYVTFDEAFTLAKNGNDSKVHVIGKLKRTSANDVIGLEYNPSVDPNYLAFTLIDNDQEEHRVICNNPPASMQDFTKSEQIVIIGKAYKGNFVASEILMKCPSKYEENEIKV